MKFIQNSNNSCLLCHSVTGYIIKQGVQLHPDFARDVPCQQIFWTNFNKNRNLKIKPGGHVRVTNLKLLWVSEKNELEKFCKFIFKIINYKYVYNSVYDIVYNWHRPSEIEWYDC
jgi:hypothetical protein